MTGFADAAEGYARHGMAVVPCEGKRPLVRWQKMTRGTTAQLLPRWCQDHPAANVGLLTGQSRITVVDIDTADASTVADCEQRFGPTPLVARTPRGGTHLFFRSSGERSAAKIDGQPIDIRGLGGFLVVPPSDRADGRRYEFVRGSVEDLERLPVVRRGAIGERNLPLKDWKHGFGYRAKISEGRRNDTLFRLALLEARDCATGDELEARMLIHNEACEPSLPYEEIKTISASAWRYEQRGQNFVGKGARVFLSVAELDRLTKSPDAAVLLLALRKAHLGVNVEFAISPAGLSAEGQFKGWSKARLRNARDFLTSMGSVVVRHEGGRGKHDPSRFAFGLIGREDTVG